MSISILSFLTPQLITTYEAMNVCLGMVDIYFFVNISIVIVSVEVRINAYLQFFTLCHYEM